jgi:hypothetical protein
MAREEQIKEAARQRANQYNHPSKWSDTYYGFIDGAKWADSHPAWVSVEDELPRETGWYLVATPTLNSKIDVALWDGKWRRLVTITHWMPLPQPPVKKGGNDAS